MKKIFIVFLLVLFAVPSINAQDTKDRESHREKIKALRVAYITQEFDMSTELAQSFWPIYNKYDCQKRDLHEREHIELDNVENISEAKAEEILKEFMSVEREEYVIKKQLFSDLKQILSAREIIQLLKLEKDFNKKLLKEYRSRKHDKNDNNK